MQEFAVSGTLAVHQDGYGFVRNPETLGDDVVYVSQSQIRRYRLRDGDSIDARARWPRDRERYPSVTAIVAVNGSVSERN